MNIETIAEAQLLLHSAWPAIVDQCRQVLGGELHYQAMIYHCLRHAGADQKQIGMNVKQFIRAPVTELFRDYQIGKHPDFRGGFEPIPDIVIFRPAIEGDWRRRSAEKTLANMLLAIEVKASERKESRLRVAEVSRDIKKLSAHRDEVRHLGGDFLPTMLVIDVAPDPAERMRSASVAHCRDFAAANGVAWLYAEPQHCECIWPTAPTIQTDDFGMA